MTLNVTLSQELKEVLPALQENLAEVARLLRQNAVLLRGVLADNIESDVEVFSAVEAPLNRT